MSASDKLFEAIDSDTDPQFLSWKHETTKLLQEFSEISASHGKAVVCVTSGGTSVPLEKNTVRSVENFSTGKRGAASAEYFLELGYATIYLYRKGCACPYARHIQSETSENIDLRFLESLKGKEFSSDILLSSSFERSKMLPSLRKFNSAIKNQSLIAISYTSITEYLWLLKQTAITFSSFGPNAIFFLAAAVSDYYVSAEEMVTHKIQSNGDDLEIKLSPVPKCLADLKQKWAPQAFIVSFKLETDEKLLIQKAKGAISSYGVHMVVANLLQTRYQEVFLVDENEETIIKKTNTIELEAFLIPEIAKYHYEFIGTQENPLQHITSKLYNKNIPWYMSRGGILDVSKVFLTWFAGPAMVIGSMFLQKYLMTRLRI